MAFLEPDSNVFHVSDSDLTVALQPDEALSVSLSLSLVSGSSSQVGGLPGSSSVGRSIGASINYVVASEEGRVRVVDVSNVEADMEEFPVTQKTVRDMEMTGNFLVVTDGVGVAVGKLAQTLVPVVYIADLRRGEEEVEKVMWSSAPGIFIAMYKSGFEVIDVATAKATMGEISLGKFRSCVGDVKRLTLGGYSGNSSGNMSLTNLAPTSTLLKLLKRQETPKKIGNMLEKFPIISVSPCGEYLALAFRDESEISIFTCGREGVHVDRKFVADNFPIAHLAFIDRSQVFVASRQGQVAIFDDGRLIKLLKFPINYIFRSLKFIHDLNKNLLVFLAFSSGTAVGSALGSGSSPGLGVGGSGVGGILIFEGSRVHVFRSEEEISDLVALVNTPDSIQVYCKVGTGNFVTEISTGRFINDPTTPFSQEEISDQQEISDQISEEISDHFEEELERLEKISDLLSDQNISRNFRSQMSEVFGRLSREKIFPSLAATVREVERKFVEHVSKMSKSIEVARISDQLQTTTGRARNLLDSLKKQKSEIEVLTRNFRSQKTEVGNLLTLKLSAMGRGPGVEALVEGSREFLVSGNKRQIMRICMEISRQKFPISPIGRLDEGYMVLFVLVRILETAGISREEFDAALRVCDFQVDCIKISGLPGNAEIRDVVETSHQEVVGRLQRIPENSQLKISVLNKLNLLRRS